MEPTTRSENAAVRPPARPRRTAAVKRYGIAVGLIGLAFLLGFVPSWVAAHRAQEQRTLSEQRLRVSELHVQLGMIAFQASRNNFADARALSTSERAVSNWSFVTRRVGRADFVHRQCCYPFATRGLVRG